MRTISFIALACAASTLGVWPALGQEVSVKREWHGICERYGRQIPCKKEDAPKEVCAQLPQNYVAIGIGATAGDKSVQSIKLLGRKVPDVPGYPGPQYLVAIGEPHKRTETFFADHWADYKVETECLAGGALVSTGWVVYHHDLALLEVSHRRWDPRVERFSGPSLKERCGLARAVVRNWVPEVSWGVLSDDMHPAYCDSLSNGPADCRSFISGICLREKDDRMNTIVTLVSTFTHSQ